MDDAMRSAWTSGMPDRSSVLMCDITRARLSWPRMPRIKGILMLLPFRFIHRNRTRSPSAIQSP